MMSRRASARVRAATAMLAAAVVAVGCGSSGAPAGAESSTLVAYTGASGDFQINFNPFAPSNLGGGGTIFQPLFFYNVLRDADPTPRLGTEFAWNEDGTQLSITLRDGVTWSDGEKFTAADVVFTLDMITKHKGMNNTGYAGRAEAVDDTHVTIAFDRPSFLDGPSVLGKTYIVPEHKWKDIADPAVAVVKDPVGTGPYVLDEFKPQAFTFKANPTYWGGEPAVKKVRYLSLSGNQAGAAALKAGQIDWQTGPVPDIKDVGKTYPGYQSTITHANQIVLVTCSSAALGCQGPQTDPAVRQAIYHAIDRTQTNALAFENTSSDISPSFLLPGRDDALLSDKLQNKTAPMRPDQAKAQQILESAGYAKGPDGIYAKDGTPVALTLSVVAGWTDYITAVDTIGQQLQQAGIKLTPQQVSWNEFVDSRDRGAFQLIIDSLYQGPAPDPYYLYNFFYSTAQTAAVGAKPGPNVSRFSDPQVDQALDALKLLNPTDTTARQPHLDTIQTRIEQAMPYIPVLTQGTVNVYHEAKFTGWPTKDDLYASPAAWAHPDNAEVFMRLRPTGK
ncbi:peptide/nickel transport system substrate-binding protein [Saccharothrix ecbatanensis]|uniref:Peptide/nickel transport system substrate-binding protein n=1 Tax=Saccharothrix ecbatanensis TaxID=1105145 RepID=A0A7W9HFI4_9PSEU|nr:ABC transporter substrate-binding protein [Saccharothrix ecbatanensis]MBB5801054.1 peptide/nickel transport system substrate-binding protein [Saccharothrix ecbatanensis]